MSAIMDIFPCHYGFFMVFFNSVFPQSTNFQMSPQWISVHQYNRSYDKKYNTVCNSDVFLNGWDTGMAGEKMGRLQRVKNKF